MALVERLRRLERARFILHGARPCEVCEYIPGTPARMEVTFGDEGNDVPDHCPGCGRQLVYRITFDDRKDSSWR